MKYRYTKFTGEDLDGIDLEELLSRLSDLLLSSGFDNPYGLPYDDETGHSMQALHDAILEALLNGGCCPTKCSRSCSARTGSSPTTPRSGSTS